MTGRPCVTAMRERVQVDAEEGGLRSDDGDDKKFKAFAEVKKAKQQTQMALGVLGAAILIILLLLVGGSNQRSYEQELEKKRELINQLGQKTSLEAVEMALKQLGKGSTVFEWGTGPSAIYFSQCVKEWNILIEEQKYCQDIKSVAPPNVVIHCFPATRKRASDVRNQLQHIGDISDLDVVLVDGVKADLALLPILHMLKPTGRALVLGFDPEDTSPGADRVQAAFRVKQTAPPDVDGKGLAVLEVKADSLQDKADAEVKAGDAEEAFTADDSIEEAGERPHARGGGDPDAAPAMGGEDPLHGAHLNVFARSREAARGGQPQAKTKKQSVFAAMEAWRNDERIMTWKRERREEIKNAQPPDKFGPPEAFPCSAKCPNSNRPLENTVCPMMFPEEQELLLSALGPESVVFEWGTGTSTLYYSQCVKSWTSIEHDSEWCHLMQSLAPPNVKIFCVPIEAWAKESFGSPGTWDGSIKEFKSYVESIHVVAAPGSLDVVLVDGRARGDCSIEALPHIRPDSKVFIHDWIKERFGGREQYDKSLDYYKIEKVVNVPPPVNWRASSGLVMLKPKKNALSAAKAAYKKKTSGSTAESDPEPNSDDEPRSNADPSSNPDPNQGWFDSLWGAS